MSPTHPGSDSPSGVITTENQQTFKDAVAAADPFVNYASFDSNGNGTVSPNELHITVITAGYEASICGTGFNSTWGHKWSAFNVGYPVADTKTITDYTMFGEAHCDGGGAYLATLGIMVHEIGHDLDWPDYYDNNDSDAGDTGANGDGGVGQWSVMATGSWAAESGEKAGATPPHPDAFNKSFQGWITPDVATGTSTKSLGQAASNPDAVQVLDNPGGVDWVNNGPSGTGEYFLIENRQKTGYDAALPGCGILDLAHRRDTADCQQQQRSRYAPSPRLGGGRRRHRGPPVLGRRMRVTRSSAGRSTQARIPTATSTTAARAA